MDSLATAESPVDHVNATDGNGLSAASNACAENAAVSPTFRFLVVGVTVTRATAGARVVLVSADAALIRPAVL